MDTKTLIHELADRQPVVEEEKVGSTPAKMDCQAVLDTLAAREKEVKVHTLGQMLGGGKT